METPPVILLPNPLPVYSLMKTILSASMFNHRRWQTEFGRCSGCRCAGRPCHSASKPSHCGFRGFDGWCLACRMFHQSTRAAFLKPASRSPKDHSSVVLPIGRRPSLASANSTSVHLSSATAGAWPPGRVTQTLPSVRGFGPPGRSVSSGSTTNGSRAPAPTWWGRGFFQEAPSGHNETGYTKGALESLFVDDALLDRVQRSILICQPFDRQDLLVAHRMCEDRARIMRHIVKQHRTGAAFGAVAPQLRSREPQLVSQRPSQRLLLHDTRNENQDSAQSNLQSCREAAVSM